MNKTIVLLPLIFFFLISKATPPEVMFEKKERGKLKEIVYNPVFIKSSNKKLNPEEVFKNFIQSKKLPLDFNSLYLTQKISNRHTTTLRYKQKVNGYPVFNSEVLGVIYRGSVLKFVNNTFENFEQPEFCDSSIIKNKLLKENPEFKRIIKIEKGYFGKKPCYRLRITAKKNLLDVFVDSKSGKILKEKSLLIHFDAKGNVFYPNPVCYSGNTSLYDNEDSNYEDLEDSYVTVTLTNIDNSGVLKNGYVDLSGHGLLPPSTFGVVGVSEYTPGSALPENGNYFFTRDDYRFEEVNAYYWITEARKYIESLGFNILPNPIPINVHFLIDDTSFYSEADHGIHFGDGGVDDAEDAEIILHEFMHAVTHYIVPGIGGVWEAQALDEGLSDYFAATFSRDTRFRDYIGEWDATYYHAGNPPWLRPIKTDRHYPENMRERYYLTWQPNYHWDGVIFSSTLWQIRKAVGKDFDRDVIESLYHISTSASFQSAAMSVYSANLLNGGNFKEAIGYFFFKRGILPENYITSVPEFNGYKLFFPYAEENSNMDSFLGLINTSNESETVHLLFISQEGFLVLKEKDINLNPGEKYYEKVNPDEIDTKFWIMAVSDKPVDGYIYFIDKDKTKSTILKGIKKLSNTLYVPHIAPETDYWNSYSAIVNGSNEQASLTVNTHEGENISLSNPNEKYTMNYLEWYNDFYNPNNITPEKNWVTIESNGECLAGYQFFTRKDVAQSGGLSLDITPSNTIYFPHIHVEGNYWWTGIVFENVLDSSEEITVFAYDSDGNLLDSFTIEQQPYQKTVCLAQNLWTNNEREFPENTAWIKLSSQSPCLIGYQLFGTLPEQGARLLAGINGIINLSTKILFPHIQTGENFWTGIAIINSSDSISDISLSAYDSDGNLLEQVDFSDINPNQKKVFLVKDIFSEDTIQSVSYIIAQSNNSICGFEISGNLTSEENGEIIHRQDYIAGMEGIVQ
ncbi:hypothetical protein TTHT_1240 [Thermotomaculum hydrothermale]|uniref:FTP domain-containing protein n=1 Tax=Thermotomaculum hydrothermale TaxID=981385 RepID=A0A7R6PZP0_9BACT|nr:M36 family metallopeptidase [Thermotomaculum hydrothermale]BBB32758.1 hypothetical protein TTHT_1240 [Thermotomaculum hydrothermale]